MPTKERDPVANQLEEWKKNSENKERCQVSTSSEGIPLETEDTSITVGLNGPICIFDTSFFDGLSHFARERIPERVVHAKGGGAFGHFICTDDITDLTTAKVFEFVGKKTDILVRFSQVTGNLGTADTQRDPRGFSIKFYTEDGNWDLVGNNTPIFFIRDPKLFQYFIHSQKRNPVTNMRDWDMFWDFLSLSPQSMHQVLFLFSDRGIPDGWRHMHGYGSNTFSLINEDNKLTYVKFHYLTNQGIKNLEEERATQIAGEEPDYAIRDLYNAIASGDHPSWTFYIQTMTPKEAKAWSLNPFDVTKTWPHREFPMKRVGKLTLDRNPANYFAEIEQAAFDPANLIPGIGPSPDRMLQGRLFSYKDAHRYRLGTNSAQLPVNSPAKLCNYLRDGFGTFNSQGGAPNYYPNSFGGPKPMLNGGTWLHANITVKGQINYFNMDDLDNYTQPRIFVTQTLTEEKRNILIENLANSLRRTTPRIREKALENFKEVDLQFAQNIRAKIESGKEAHL